ncbi:MAG: hypothetical protein JST63_04300 [Bacteroidetes bacterium]|nr:hypothetical protein [Bacteroidota bacterium]
MIEVFKTNVKDHFEANMLPEEIHRKFFRSKANLDLTDCDNILRVKCSFGIVKSGMLINLLEQHGGYNEVLPDEINLPEGNT